MKKFGLHHDYILTFFLLCLVLFPSLAIASNCTCDQEEDNEQPRDKSLALKYKFAALSSILVASTIGVCIPVLGKSFPVLHPEKDIFFIFKAFAAGVILATGFIHVLPDAFEKLTSPLLGDSPWEFPFTGLVAMMAAMLTLMIDAFATVYFRKIHFNEKDQFQAVDEEGRHEGHLHTHTHATHGHAHGSATAGSTDLLRHRVISQVLELGIVVHSVIIGISLGASGEPGEIRPLIAALTFHQFFEGIGLGGCIAQAKFKAGAVITMALFFSLTTPVGIGIGMLITNGYDEDSSTALIVEGILNAASAGILIYMSLVDLLAADFMNPRMQNSGRLQIGANVSLLFGAGCMSVLAKWA